MKYITKYLSLGLLLSVGSALHGSCSTTNAGCAPIRTSWVNMTSGQNLYTQYHKLLFPEGAELDYNDCDSCSWAMDLSATYRFQQSRNGCNIANALWGSSDLIFQGSDIETRNPQALVAEYFGMGPDTDIIASMSPRLRNQILDFQLEISGEKVWAQINLPLMWSKWSATKGCGAPSTIGQYGTKDLDGSDIKLQYTTPATAGTLGVLTINDLPASGLTGGANGGATNVWFDATGSEGTTANSFIGQLADQALTNVDTDESDVTQASVSVNGGAQSQQYVGATPMGVYGSYSSTLSSENAGATTAEFSVSSVPAAPTLLSALNNYTFGQLETRNNNLFNFSPCTKFGLADIPIMLGYDFCKSDAYHLGLYLKFVIPTGTKIDSCFLQYVLSPVIGNGRHFELGIGASAHANIWVCDTSSFGVYGDGYIDYMYGACQTRTFDLAGQPMSRYALVYPLSGDAEEGLSTTDTMSAVGDVNLYQGNTTATRGEFMFDFIWACRNWEMGIGYAFAGQTSEKINCNSCPTSSSDTSYALVGNVPQNQFAVGPVSAASGTPTWQNGVLNVTGTTGSGATAGVNFFNLGSTGNAAAVNGENAAYNYGESTPLDEAALSLPDTQGNCSGLMSGQILNKIFGHIDYVWRDCAWQPEFGILGSIGFVPSQYVTANYWDLGARVGFAF